MARIPCAQPGEWMVPKSKPRVRREDRREFICCSGRLNTCVRVGRGGECIRHALQQRMGSGGGEIVRMVRVLVGRR